MTAKALMADLARTLAIVAACALALWLLDIWCIIRAMTGVPCPGCGMTRAWLAFLRGDVPAALAYHPLFWAVPIATGVAVLQGRLPSEATRVRRACEAIALMLVVAFVALWSARLASPTDAGLLFGGAAPAGVPADIIHVEQPIWLRVFESLR